ncbi:MAG: DNA polymerase I [Pseudomonadota bacterium]
MSDSPLVLVDGSSYLFRAFHALPPLTTSGGQPTGAIHGVINMLKNLRERYQPEQFVVVFDAPGKTFRDDLYVEYKANRPPMPDELRSQIEPLHALIRAQGLPLIAITGVEADDVIGTMAREASEAGKTVVISTGDKDLAQLVNDKVSLINTMTDTVMDTDGVVAKFGVPPERIIDYLALVGDKVDNIPGVPGCGPKTAVKWLTEYGNLDAVIAASGDVKGKIGERLRDALDTLPLSRELATIKLDVEHGLTEDELSPNAPDVEALRELYTELEMKTALKNLGGAQDVGEQAASGSGSIVADTADSPVATRYSVITTAADLAAWVKKLKMVPVFAFDTETTSLDYMAAELVGVSVAVAPGLAAYIPVAHRYEGAPAQLERDTVLDALRPLLEDPARCIVGQNLKYDISVLARHGLDVRSRLHDTMLQSYVLDAAGSRHDMDTLASKHLGHTCVKFEDIAGKGKSQLTFDQIELEPAAHYAAEDADITLRLHQALWPQLEAEPALKAIYERIELPLVPVLSKVERNGVQLDSDMLGEQSAELERAMADAEQKAHDAAGKVFNLSSPKQIQQIFFEEQGMPVIRKTPKGQPSTAEDVLEQLADDYDLPRLILEHRSLSKLKSTYTDKLPLQVSEATGRVHTSYHQAVAATGRLSSTDPNLQNIPVRTPEGRRIREAFVPAEGNCLLAADYSQIELRIMAHLSEDAGLLNAFANKLDVHRATASEVFDTPLEDVSSDQRRSAKAVNFGLIYGMSAFGLARQLGIGRGEAQETIDRYFDRYPGVKRYMDETRAQAHDVGYVQTVFGRRLYLHEIHSRNAQMRAYAERTAINAPMQGTAADIIKKAMIDVQAWLDRGDVDARMIMQVHDELVFDVAASDVERLSAEVSDRMARVAELSVPLEVDTGVGHSWEQAH